MLVCFASALLCPAIIRQVPRRHSTPASSPWYTAINFLLSTYKIIVHFYRFIACLCIVLGFCGNLPMLCIEYHPSLIVESRRWKILEIMVRSSHSPFKTECFVNYHIFLFTNYVITDSEIFPGITYEINQARIRKSLDHVCSAGVHQIKIDFNSRSSAAESHTFLDYLLGIAINEKSTWELDITGNGASLPNWTLLAPVIQKISNLTTVSSQFCEKSSMNRTLAGMTRQRGF